MKKPLVSTGSKRIKRNGVLIFTEPEGWELKRMRILFRELLKHGNQKLRNGLTLVFNNPNFYSEIYFWGSEKDLDFITETLKELLNKNGIQIQLEC